MQAFKPKEGWYKRESDGAWVLYRWRGKPLRLTRIHVSFNSRTTWGDVKQIRPQSAEAVEEYLAKQKEAAGS